jgi:hypothetical protein
MGLDAIEAEGGSSRPHSTTPRDQGIRAGYRPRVPVRAPAARRRAFAQLASVVLGIAAITCYVQIRSVHKSARGAPVSSIRPRLSPPEPVIVDEPDAETETKAIVETKPNRVEPVPPPPIDRAALAEAEAALDAASRDRARADSRAAQLSLWNSHVPANWPTSYVIRRPGSPRPRPAAGSCAASVRKSRKR